MKDGFIKVAAATPEIALADPKTNAANTLELLKKCASMGVNLAVFPELGLTGLTCAELFTQDALIAAAARVLEKFAQSTIDIDTVAVVGLPFKLDTRLYNCAAVVCRGRILGVVPKSCLQGYGEFYENRYFTPANGISTEVYFADDFIPFGTDLLFCCPQIPDFKFAVEICEDMWVPSPPSLAHTAAGAAIIANLSAGCEIAGKENVRVPLVAELSQRLCCGYVYASAGRGESTSDVVFSGHNIIAECGSVLSESAPFGDGFAATEIDVSRLMHERLRMNRPKAQSNHRVVNFFQTVKETQLTRNVPAQPFFTEGQGDTFCETVLRIQTEGLSQRLKRSDCTRAVVGVSGGLDSTLALIVAARSAKALGWEASSVLAVTMPGFGTGERTRSNAQELIELLGAEFRCIDITASVRQHFTDIGHDENDHSVVYENAQARERTQILMDLANGCGGLVVGTGDLSEIALGWSTFNGDHMSMYCVNGGVPKSLIRRVVAYAAAGYGGRAEAVLRDIIDTPVSPELLPGEQHTESIIGPYELHDFFLYYMVRWGMRPKKIYRMACYAFAGQFLPDEIKKWLRVFIKRFFQSQFKRDCMPDGPKVCEVSLSPRGDWRMPSDAAAAAWLSELD